MKSRRVVLAALISLGALLWLLVSVPGHAPASARANAAPQAELPTDPLPPPGPAVDPPTAASAPLHRWQFSTVTILGGAGGTLAMTLTLAGTLRVQRNRARRRERETQATARELQMTCDKTKRELQREVLQRRNLEEEVAALQGRVSEQVHLKTAELVRKCRTLEKELNSRCVAERSFSVQRQELERSKDVLTMHVQARAQELEKLQRQYALILNSAGEGIYGLDLEGRMTFVNPTAARLTGYTVDELVGMSEAEMFLQEASAALAPEATDPGDPRKLGAEQTFRRKDGTRFLVEYIRTPLMENDRTTGTVVMFKDITERKRAEEALSHKAAELARSNAELEQFAFVASHDLQEPLRKIQAFGDRLKTRLDSAQITDGRDYLERIQNAAARMQTLINDLLTFSRMLSRSQPFVQVDLNLVVREVLSDLEVAIEKKKAQVDVAVLPTIAADPVQMRQLIQNLVSNSLKFQRSESRPHVRIEAEIVQRPFSCAPDPAPDDKVCELRVTDNGIGFDEKYLDRIFAVFQRLHGRSEYEGTGVGLAVCRRITDRHGGSITARSQPGKGATFIVSLPVRQPRHTQAT